MPQTATTLQAALKEEWTDQELNKQYFTDDSILSRIEQITGDTIGLQASVPIQLELSSAGYTSTGPQGGLLNPAGNQPVDKAFYTLVQHFQQIGLEFSAINQASGNNLQAVVGAKNLEVTRAIESLRNQATRQLVTNGDGIVAQCGTTSSSATVNLIPSPSSTAYGFDALQRNWLRRGALVDIGTTADTDSVVTGAQVLGVTESASGPQITINSSVSTTSGTHNVYIANPNSATAPNPESNGLRNIISTQALGGINPATAGYEAWQPSQVDTSTSILSLDLLLSMTRAVQQKTDKRMTKVWSGLKQEFNYYALLQNQVRFANDGGVAAGENIQGPRWGGMEWEGFNAILDSDLFFVTPEDLCRVTGAIKTPTWFSTLQGSNQGMLWAQGTTGFVDGIAYAFQVGAKRRNTSARASALTA